jgi:hypothetical protein
MKYSNLLQTFSLLIFANLRGQKTAAENAEPPRVRYVTSRWDIEKGTKVIEDDTATKPETKLDGPEKDPWAFTFHTVLNDDNKFAYTSIDVQDLDLKLLLHHNLSHYPGLTFPGDREILSFIGPYAAIVHNWDRLEKASKLDEKDSKEVKISKGDLQLLLECVKSSPELEDYFKVRDAYLRAHVTSYQWQWTLFSPGGWIYTEPCLNQPQIMEVGSIGMIGSSHNIDPAPNWVLSAWFYDWNGLQLEKKSVLLRIDKYVGTKPIESLVCYPVEFYRAVDMPELQSPDTVNPIHTKFPPIDDLRPDRRTILPKKLTDSLLQRGRDFQKYCTAGEGRKAMFRYDGQVLFKGYGVAVTNDNNSRSSNQFSDVSTHELLELDGRIIANDFKAI